MPPLVVIRNYYRFLTIKVFKLIGPLAKPLINGTIMLGVYRFGLVLKDIIFQWLTLALCVACREIIYVSLAYALDKHDFNECLNLLTRTKA